MNIAVLVSGGVDSSVALQMLIAEGHTVTAFYLKIWLEDELAYLGTCPWHEDLSYVQQVCHQLSVQLEVISLQTEYADRVVNYTLNEIKQGRTPNPDILCNAHIKFDAFFNKISSNFDKIATGHYAQIALFNKVYYLKMGPDKIKDQTYFLSYLSQAQLSRLVFPIGHLPKAQVRKLAQEYALPNKDRKDSQGICFLGKLKFSDFVKHHFGQQEGDLVEYETGLVKGTHNGFWFYTIGQRQGIGLAGGPWYVVAKNTDKNIIHISRNYYDQNKKRNSFCIRETNWFLGKLPDIKEVQVKLRHGAHTYAANINQHSDGTVEVLLDQHDQGIASGQFAVFYQQEICLGGGIIV